MTYGEDGSTPPRGGISPRWPTKKVCQTACRSSLPRSFFRPADEVAIDRASSGVPSLSHVGFPSWRSVMEPGHVLGLA